MVVQSYENNVLDTEKKGQRSGMIAIQDVAYTGNYEIKIFREGFETESSNIWIEVAP